MSAQFERGRHGALAKQALALPHRDREDLQPEFVDQVVLDEGLQEVGAAVDLQVGAVAGFELADLRRDVASQEDGRRPFVRRERVRDDVLGGPVDAGPSSAWSGQ